MLKCDFDGHCQINLDTRHICSYCRLMKCFASGMEIEKIRASRVTTTKRKLTRDLIRLNESEQTKVFNCVFKRNFCTLIFSFQH